MASYHILYILKFIAIMVFSGGFMGAFLSKSDKERKFAVHGIASPGLTAVWFIGFLLARETHYPLTSFFIVWGFLLSLLSLFLAMLAVSKQRHGMTPFIVAASPLILVLYLMVTRPTDVF